MENPSRRVVGQGLGASIASLLFGRRGEARESSFEFLPSNLNAIKLQEHKETAARGIVDTFWSDEQLRTFHLANAFKGKKNRTEVEQDLISRSKMNIPNERDALKIFADYPKEIAELINNTPLNSFAFFSAGDMQKTFVIKNLGQGKVQFEKSYAITTSKEEWSNVLDSDGTSLGSQWVARKRIGVFGEVISEKDRVEKKGHFETVQTKSGPRLIAKSLDYKGNEHATVMSFGLELWDRVNKSLRGELFHATNREDVLGQRASGGCTRILHVDMFDMLQYASESTFNAKGEMVRPGTPVMVAAKGFVPRHIPNEAEKKRIAEKKAAKERAKSHERPSGFDFSLPAHLR